MTEQKACTLCGAGGHSAAQCNWNKALELLRAAKQFTWDLQSPADLRLRIDDFLASQQVEKCISDTGSCGVGGYCAACPSKHPEQAEGAQGERVSPDKGPWHAVKWDGGKRVDLSSDDFTHDVALTVSGDFVEGDKFRYAQQLAAWMNAALAQPSPAPDQSEVQLGMVEMERPEVVAWMWRDLSGDVQFNYMHPEGQELMTVAQHDRILLRASEIIDAECKARAFAEHHRDMAYAERDAALARVAELVAALERAATAMWNSEANMDNEAAAVEESIGDAKSCAPVAQAGRVPEGWKLVPIEPTEWPLEAGVKAYNAAVKSGCEQIDCIYDALHEMLAAAPAQGGE